MTSALHIIHSGELAADAVAGLDATFDLRFHRVSEVAEGERLASISSEINRQIDEIAGWILLIRSGETVSDGLASEIARLVCDQPAAWAFRIAVIEHYCGAPLFRAPRRSAGEIRLFHSRRCRYQPKGERTELQSKGTVIRLEHPLVTERYRTIREHVEDVSSAERPAGVLSRIPRFLFRLSQDRNRLTSRSVRYHWIEAGREKISGES